MWVIGESGWHTIYVIKAEFIALCPDHLDDRVAGRSDLSMDGRQQGRSGNQSHSRDDTA